MKTGTIKELIKQHGLPLDIKKTWWYGDYYFHAEKINRSGEVSGWIYKDGEKANPKSFGGTEIMQLRELDEAEEDSNTPNPNGLDVRKQRYVKGETKLFIIKDNKLVTVYFDRFEKKEGKHVIYVIAEGETEAKFYSFPQTTYLFQNKDDALRKLDGAKRSYKQTVPSLRSYKQADPVSDTVYAFSRLPTAKTPSKSKVKETEYEKGYHKKVDRKLETELVQPRSVLKNAKRDRIEEEEQFRELLVAARDDKCRLSDSAYISHELKLVNIEKNAKNAQKRATELESIQFKPYFARIDCGEDVTDLHTAYIGYHDIDGFVVDWRHTSVMNVYYQSALFMNRKDVFLALKRIFTIQGGVFKEYTDELNLYHGEEYKQRAMNSEFGADALLTNLLLESRLDKKTHDIIKTIQGEQYDIITSDFQQNIVVNGCAGSGKTMIMYHRLSYMAYNYEGNLQRKFDPNSVYIISPSAFFDSSHDDLMKKLSLDTIHQAPFETQVDELIGKYCAQHNVVQFQGMIRLLNANGTPKTRFFSEEAFADFSGRLDKLCKGEEEKEYKDWILNTANNLLEFYDFKRIPDELVFSRSYEIDDLFNDVDYYQNACFLKKDQTIEGYKYYSPIAVTSISYENVELALNMDKGKGVSVQREKRIKKYLRMLKVALSLKPKRNTGVDLSASIPDFWNLLDNNLTVFEKMLALIIAQKILKCLFVSEDKDTDYVLKCLFVYQKYFHEENASDFNVYVLRAMSEKFGSAIKEESLVFVDEFQNYSSFEIACLKSAFAKPVFNLFGDYDQRIEDKGMELRENIDDLLSPYAYNININYRNAKEITEYINYAVHKNMQPIGVEGNVTETTLSDCVFKLKDRTAIICRDIKTALPFLKKYIDPKLINNVSSTGELSQGQFALMTVADCKGLEFDTVYVLSYDLSDNEKYVAYTRALDHLTVISDDLEAIKQSEEEAKRREREERRERAKTKAAKEKQRAARLRFIGAVKQVLAVKQMEEFIKLEMEIERADEENRTSKFIYELDLPDEAEDFANVDVNVTEDREWQNVEEKSPVPSQTEDVVSKKERYLDEQLQKVAQYIEYLERRDAEMLQAQRIQQEKIYSLALAKMDSDELDQLKEATVLLETIIGYKDALERLADVKVRTVKVVDYARKQRFREQNLCQHCGGKVKVFSSICSNCGKKERLLILGKKYHYI